MGQSAKTLERSIREKASDGPVGPMVPALFVDYHLRRVEASLQSLHNLDMDLEQAERLEAALTKAHVRNQIRVTEYLETHPEADGSP